MKDRDALSHRLAFANGTYEVEPAAQDLPLHPEWVRAGSEGPVVEQRHLVTGDVEDADRDMLATSEGEDEARFARAGIRRRRGKGEGARLMRARHARARDRIQAVRLLLPGHVVEPVAHDLSGVVDIVGAQQEPPRRS